MARWSWGSGPKVSGRSGSRTTARGVRRPGRGRRAAGRGGPRARVGRRPGGRRGRRARAGHLLSEAVDDGRATIVLRLPPEERPSAGSRLRVAVAPHAVRLFDATTGLAIRPVTAGRPHLTLVDEGEDLRPSSVARPRHRAPGPRGRRTRSRSRGRARSRHRRATTRGTRRRTRHPSRSCPRRPCGRGRRPRDPIAFGRDRAVRARLRDDDGRQLREREDRGLQLFLSGDLPRLGGVGEEHVGLREDVA